MPGRPRHHASKAAKQAAYRRRKSFHQLVALQEKQAQLHVGGSGVLPYLQPHATDEQHALQAEAKERDMLDALWMLQTLIADFGYEEVYTHVLQHLRQTHAIQEPLQAAAAQAILPLQPRHATAGDTHGSPDTQYAAALQTAMPFAG
jgi:hypothetical protein